MLVIEIDAVAKRVSGVFVRAKDERDEDRSLIAWQKIRPLVDSIDSKLKEGRRNPGGTKELLKPSAPAEHPRKFAE
jgi:hypothetical protein